MISWSKKQQCVGIGFINQKRGDCRSRRSITPDGLRNYGPRFHTDGAELLLDCPPVMDAADHHRGFEHFGIGNTERRLLQ
jgi:hypothetical protein